MYTFPGFSNVKSWYVGRRGKGQGAILGQVQVLYMYMAT